MLKLIILIGFFTVATAGGGGGNNYDSPVNQIAWWDTVRLI